MRVIHRVTLVDEPERRSMLASLGVRFGTPESPLVRVLWFDIEEADPAWGQLRTIIPKWNIEDGCNPANLGMVHAEFSKRELEAAPFLQVFAWLNDYPQPSDDCGYRKLTYDLANYCSTCGIGKTQIAPFRLKSEPKWGKRRIMQLNWVFDEFFVHPEVWEQLFRPVGINCIPVLEHNTGKPLQTVVQLQIDEVATSALSMADQPSEMCSICARKKFVPITGKFFPPFTSKQSGNLFKTQECFGSGASAWNATVASSSVYRAVQGLKLSSMTFVPMSASDSTD